LDEAFSLALPQYLFYLIFQAVRRREVAQGEMFREIGLTVPKWRALAVVRRLGECAMSELAQLSAVDRTTLTRTVDQLVDDGLVERFTSSSDRRLTLLRLTEAGAATFAKAIPLNGEHLERMLQGVPLEQRIIALRVFQKVLDNMIDDDDEIAFGVLTFSHTFDHEGLGGSAVGSDTEGR
jgi:DNA-binding MarR family transcriptional regulator